MSKLIETQIMKSNLANATRLFHEKSPESRSSSVETTKTHLGPKMKNQQISLDLLSLQLNCVDKINMNKVLDESKTSENGATSVDADNHSLKMQQIVESAIGCVEIISYTFLYTSHLIRKYNMF